MRRHNEEMWMNSAESKGLKKGNRVYWRGDANDGGIITDMSWDAVTIAWDNGHVATVGCRLESNQADALACRSLLHESLALGEEAAARVPVHRRGFGQKSG